MAFTLLGHILSYTPSYCLHSSLSLCLMILALALEALWPQPMIPMIPFMRAQRNVKGLWTKPCRNNSSLVQLSLSDLKGQERHPTRHEIISNNILNVEETKKLQDQPTSHLPVYSPIRTFQIRLTLLHRLPGHCFVPRSIISSRLPLKLPQFLVTPTLMSWRVFLDCLALKVPSLHLCLQRHHIYPSFLTWPQWILILKRLRISFLSIVLRVLKTFLSIKPSLLQLVILSPEQFGARSFLICSSTLRNFLLQWTRGTITTMNQRILGLALHWLRRIKPSLSVCSSLKLTGHEYLVHGLQAWLSSSLTGMLSFGTISPLSWIFSKPLQQILLSLFHSMCIFVTSIQRSLSIELNSTCLSLLRCSHWLHWQIPHMLAKEPSHLRHPLQATMQSMPMCLAATGALVCVSLRSVQIATSMGSAVSAVKDTERKTMNSALISSKLATECELLGVQENVTTFAEKGPRPLNRSSLKHNASPVTLDPPWFCWGFVWSDNSIDLILPLALYTESALLYHLLNISWMILQFKSPSVH